MKKLFLTLLIGIISLGLYAQDGIKVKYAYKSYLIVPQNGTLSEDQRKASFGNDDLSIEVSPVKLSGAGFKSFNITVKNKTSKKLSIHIDESYYISGETSLPLADGKTLLINLENAEKRWSIPPRAKSSKELCQKFRDDFDRKNLCQIGDLSIYLTYSVGEEQNTKDASFDFKVIRKSKKK